MLSDAQKVLKDLLTNPILLSCISSWFCAQFIKTVINILYGRIHNIFELVENMLWVTGGLPSSHCALVMALTTTIGFKDGFTSDIFILSLCFLMVTVRDAVGVRRSNGLQARKINEMGRALGREGLITFKKIKEVNGHTPLEVTLGCLLGLFIGVGFSVLSN